MIVVIVVYFFVFFYVIWKGMLRVVVFVFKVVLFMCILFIIGGVVFIVVNY